MYSQKFYVIIMWKYLYLLIFFIHTIYCDNYSFINLPEEHLPYYFTNFNNIKLRCEEDVECPYRDHTNIEKCWGYEYGCKWNKQYSIPACPGDHKGWVKSKLDQQKTFYSQADFGYIKDQQNEMKVICEPLFPDDSSLECTEHLRFCRGRNLMLNFTSLINREEPIRYQMDVLKEGDIGGYCEFKKDILESQLDHMSPLQSWSPELRYFTKLSEKPIVNDKCDIVIEKPTFIMKIDATVNMYHHFCDFLNLYASIHLNATHWDAFSTDVNILIWETYTYNSAFMDSWEAFTDHQVWDLKTFRGEVVCFKNVIFPFLPRMIFGLYYNTPIIYGCEKSGLFHAFSKHILHRLKVPIRERKDKKIQITLLSRDTKYRNILNERELVETLENNEEYVIKKVIFNRHVSFKEQLQITRNTDIFIGIHGAGLTHLLFLPDWAVLFELYNCEDPNCYLDLTRLRGLKYITWENMDKIKQQDEGSHPNGGAHAKFTNYSFDKEEFARLVEVAAKHVKNHPQFKKFVQNSIREDAERITQHFDEEDVHDEL